MKVLIVNALDVEGGAARAAYRLHQALLMEGIDSKMLVQQKISDDHTVIAPKTKWQRLIGKFRPILDNLPVHLYKNRDKTLFSPDWFGFSSAAKLINEINPDIVHLHWVNHGMIHIEELSKIKAPIIWSMHDNWVFTGGCHIKWDCDKFIQRCGGCPRLGSQNENDLSRSLYKRKQRAFAKVPNMIVVALSSWLAKNANDSSLLKSHKVVCLPNPINTETFSPFDKSKARTLLSLPQDKKLVAFGAMSATSDLNKGFEQLKSALSLIKDSNVELIVFGSSEPNETQGFRQKAIYLGRLYDNVTLRALYSAVDVLVVPSIQEAFGQTATESMACGTPVVTFGATGLLDIVDHKVSGYLAEPYDSSDLAKGIDWVLNHANYEELRNNARNKIINAFDSKFVVQRYIDLYKKTLAERE